MEIFLPEITRGLIPPVRLVVMEPAIDGRNLQKVESLRFPRDHGSLDNRRAPGRFARSWVQFVIGSLLACCVADERFRPARCSLMTTDVQLFNASSEGHEDVWSGCWVQMWTLEDEDQTFLPLRR